jgi:hypothetical protein
MTFLGPNALMCHSERSDPAFLAHGFRAPGHVGRNLSALEGLLAKQPHFS